MGEGGVATYLSQLCNNIADDFDIYLAYSLRKEISVNLHDTLNPKIKLIQLKYLGQKSITNIPNAFKIIHELRELERKIQPDIIHLHSSIAGGFGRLAFDGKRSTVIYTPHGYAHVCMGPGIKSKIYYILEKILGRKKCITLTCCESEDDVARTLTRDTAYIETGINIAEMSNSLDKVAPIKREKFTVYTLGRARVQKQPKLFNHIAELVPEANFVWIGSGDCENELNAPNMQVTGWMPRDKALALAKGADAFILCSLGEAIAMSLLENMYMKKLILVSNVMGNKSVIQDGINGYICETAEDYANRIKAAMKKFPVELPERAYQDILTRYNTQRMKEKFIKFYKTLCSGVNFSFSD